MAGALLAGAAAGVIGPSIHHSVTTPMTAARATDSTDMVVVDVALAFAASAPTVPKTAKTAGPIQRRRRAAIPVSTPSTSVAASTP